VSEIEYPDYDEHHLRGFRHRATEDELAADEARLRESLADYRARAETEPAFAGAYATLELALATRAVAVEIELASPAANAVRTAAPAEG